MAINPPRVARRPADAKLQVPPGFKVELYASGFRYPLFLLTAPNGDIFVVESRANQIKVLRDTNADGKPELTEIFAERDLNKPFGIALYPPGDDPFLRGVPLARYGTADEVAQTIAFLLSPAAGYISGATITIDGGLTISPT